MLKMAGPQESFFRDGIISGTSYRSSKPTLPSDAHFDVAILFPSWDRRCLNPLRTELTADTIILVVFENQGHSGSRVAHDESLRKFAHERAKHVVEIRGRSVDLFPVWAQLYDALAGHEEHSLRAPRIYVDLSAASRFYALGAISLAFELASEYVVVTYSEAHYPKQEPDQHELFTVGRWKTAAVPGRDGIWDPSKRRNWIVTLGFEGAKTFRAVSTAEPDRLGVVVPDPPVHPDYVRRTLEMNEELIRQYAVRTNEMVRAHAGDAVDAWRQTAGLAERFSGDNLDLVCAGTKPHALGMTLLSIASETPSVLYLAPAEHKEVLTEPTDQHWTYVIRNHAVI